MTCSIGFRAPSAAEVLTHFTDFLGQFLSDEGATPMPACNR